MQDPVILNIETSAKECTICISEGETAICVKQSNGQWMHSKEITLLIKSALKESGIKIKEVQAVAVSQGPGSYTGLRVGTSAAKALCYALNIPLIGLPTLKIIASQFVDSLNPAESIIPTIDARRDEVYYQIFDAGLNEISITNNEILNSESFHDFQKTNSILCGDGSQKASDILPPGSFRFINCFPSAQFMPPLAMKSYIAQDFADVAYFSPFYLKSPNITKSKKTFF